MYFLALIIGYALFYFAAYFLYPYFFEGRAVKPTDRSWISIVVIVLAFFAAYSASAVIQDLQLRNRVLHAFGGGFLASLICWLAVRDSRLRIGRFRFFVFTFLLVMTLGVANEIAEYFLQGRTGMVFATDVNDTWLDLLSNAVGALLGWACLTPFVARTEVAKKGIPR